MKEFLIAMLFIWMIITWVICPSSLMNLITLLFFLQIAQKIYNVDMRDP